MGVTYAGLQAFISGGYDSTLAASFGLDPLMVTGLSTLAMLGAGWLIGPFFGGAVFGVRYRSIGGEIQRVSFEFLFLMLELKCLGGCISVLFHSRE